MSDATAEDTGESSNCSRNGSFGDYVSCEGRTLSTGQLVGGGFAIFGTLLLLLGCMCWGIAAHRRKKRRKMILVEKADRRRVIRERERSWVEPDGTVHWQRERERQWEPSHAAEAQGSGPARAHVAPSGPSMQQVSTTVREGPDPASIPSVRRAEDPLVIPYLGVPRRSSTTLPERVAANHPDMPAADAGPDLNHKLAMRRQAERSGSSNSNSSHSSGGSGRTLLGRSNTGAHSPEPAQPPIIMPSPSQHVDTSLSRSTTRPLNIRRPTVPVTTDPSRRPLAHQTSLPSYDESQRLSSPYAHDAVQLQHQQTADEQPAFRTAMHSPPRSESLDERAEDVPREVDSELEDEPGVVHTARQVMVSQPRKGFNAPSGIDAAGSEVVVKRKGSGQSATNRGGMI